MYECKESFFTSVNQQPVATDSCIGAAEKLVKTKTWRKYLKAENQTDFSLQQRHSGPDLLSPSLRAQYQLTARRAATLQKFS